MIALVDRGVHRQTPRNNYEHAKILHFASRKLVAYAIKINQMPNDCQKPYGSFLNNF